jgi:nitrite reductase/ring-hydroxylating ferredoxin subunit
VAFERVARLCDLPAGRGHCVQVRGRAVGLYRVGERVYAMEDVCPHAGYPLHEGDLDGTCIVCPGHGWTFDLVTGLAPGEIEEPPLERFPVRIVGDEIWIDVARPPDAAGG